MLTSIKWYWLSLGISTKISISLSSIILGALVIALGGTYQNNLTTNKLNRVTSVLLPATLLTQSCVNTFDEQLKFYEDTLLTGDEMFLLIAQKKNKSTQQALTQLIPLISNIKIKQVNIQQLQQNLTTYTNAANQIFEQVINSGTDIDETITNKTFSLATKAHNLQEQFRLHNLLVNRALEDELQDIGTLSAKSSTMGAIIFTIVLSIAICIAIMFTRSVTKPIVALATNANSISQGIWCNNLIAVGDDEVATLTRTFSTMVANTQYRTMELEQINKKLRQEIVDRKSAEKEKRSLEKQLLHAEKMQSLGTLAAGIAHDFNNLLTPIIGFSELIKLSLKEDDKNKKQINEILLAGNRGKDMVKQIMAFSQKGSDDKTKENIATIVADAITQLRASIPAAITIDKRIDTTSGMILADSTQIHQVIMNLGVNGYHAIGDQEGILSIHVSPVEITKEENTQYNIKLGLI